MKRFISAVLLATITATTALAATTLSGTYWSGSFQGSTPNTFNYGTGPVSGGWYSGQSFCLRADPAGRPIVQVVFAFTSEGLTACDVFNAPPDENGTPTYTLFEKPMSTPTAMTTAEVTLTLQQATGAAPF